MTDDQTPLDPPAPEEGPSLISDRLRRVLDAQAQDDPQLDVAAGSQFLSQEEAGPRPVAPAWALALLGGLVGGFLLAFIFRAGGPTPAPPAPIVAERTPAPVVTDPGQALARLMAAPPRGRAGPGKPGSLPAVLLEAQTSDPVARKELREKLQNQVEIGRLDPFRKVLPVKPPRLTIPAPLPEGIAMPPPALVILPTPAPTAPPRMETIQLRLSVVMSGPKPLGLVEVIREGRQFKERVGVGQRLLEEFTVKALDVQRAVLQSKRFKLTLPIGQPKMFQRSVPALPMAAPPLPPLASARKG